MLPPLRFLDFEVVDDGVGVVTLEATVSVRPERKADVLNEWARVWEWADRSHPGMRGALDEGGEWEGHTNETLDDDGWWTAVFTLTGREAFARAFESNFG